MKAENLKILAIDDNQDNLIALQAVLQDVLPEASILTALNGRRGIELARIEDPDVVLLDIVMPGMDGFAVCRELKADQRLRAIPVIFLTALKTGRESRVRALEAGAEGFLAKPPDETELVAQIRAMAKIKAANQRQQLEKEQLAALVAERTRELEKELAERARVEVALKASEEKYRGLFNSIRDAILVADTNRNIIDCNAAFTSLFGYTLGELQGKQTVVVYENEEEFHELGKALREHFGDTPFLKTVNYRKKTGEVFPGETGVFYLTDDRGKVTGFIGLIRDISERKRAEEALRFTQFAIDNMMDAVYWMGPDARFIYVNDAACKAVGYSREELLTMSVHDIVPEFPQEVWPTHWQELRQRKFFVLESIHQRKDGSIFPVEIANNHFQFGDKEYNCAFARDISVRKRAQKALQISEKRYRSLFEHSNDAIFLHDLAGKIIEVNQKTLTLLGYQKDEILQCNIRQLHPESALEKSRTAFETIFDRGAVNFDIDFKRKNGEIFPAAVSSAILELGEEKIILGIARDITEWVRAEKRISRLLDQQMAINRIALLLGSTLDLPVICQIAHQEILRIVDCAHFGIFLYDEAKQEISALYLIGDGQPIDVSTLPKAPLEPDTGPQSRAIVSRQPDIVSDLIEQLPRIKTHITVPTQDRRQVRSVLTVPMIIDERVIGTMQIQSYNVGVYTSAEAELLSGIANQVALTIQNANLYAQAQQELVERERAQEQLRRTMQQLEASEKRLQTIIETEPEGVKILDPNGILMEMNQAGLDMIEADSLAQVQGQSIFPIIAPEHRQAFRTMLDKVIRGNVEMLAFEMIGLKGTRRWLESHTVPLYDAENKVTSLLGVTRDITERKKLEEALVFERDKFDFILRELPIGVSVLDADHKFIYVNPTSMKLDGYPARPETILGQHVTDHHPKRKQPKVTQLLHDFVSGKKTVFTREDKRGKRTVGISYHALRDAQNRYLGLLRLVSDISERKQAEEKVRRQAERQIIINELGRTLATSLEIPRLCRIAYEYVRRLLDCANFSISLFDAEEQLLTAAYVISDGEEVDISQLPPLPHDPQASGGRSKALTSGRAVVVHDRIELARKSELAVKIGAEPQPDSALYLPMVVEDHVVGLVELQSYQAQAYSEEDADLMAPIANQIGLSIQNARLLAEIRQHAAVLELRVVERTAALQARVAQVEQLNQGMLNILDDLQAANQRAENYARNLEQANAELTSFSYSVSHDLRAPLRGIDGWSLALLEDYGDQLDEQAHQYLDRVRSEAQRMGRLIDDLLALSRVSRAEMQRETVDLTAMAQTIAARLQEEQQQRQVEFVIQEGLTAQGDAHLLEIVLTNLLGNAWKYTGPRELAHIEFGQIKVEGQPTYFVRDNGVGFDMAHASKLFGAFQRLHTPSEFPGTGIGLTTVQRIIRRHGGQVWAEAEVGKGATFRFTLKEEA